MVVLVGITAASVAFLARRAVLLHALPDGLGRLRTHVQLLANDVQTSVGAVRSDVLALGALPATTEALRDDATGRAARDRLTRLFLAVLGAKPTYVQMVRTASTTSRSSSRRGIAGMP